VYKTLQRKFANPARRRVFIPASREIVQEPAAVLIALLRLFVHEFGDDAAQGGGNVGISVVNPRRFPGQMRVDQFERIGG
jgi:hypothetical protein